MKPLFIVVDGIDGAGKSTIVEYIKNLYIQDNKSVVVTRGLGGGEIGIAIRKRLLTNTNCPPVLEVTSALAALMETYLDVIKPALDNGNTVICDRYVGSFVSYQVYARRHKWIYDTLHKAIDNIPNYHDPDVYIYCDVSQQKAKERLATRDEINHFDTASSDFKSMLKLGYEMYYYHNTNKFNIRLDCNKDLELVLKDVKEIYYKFTKQEK